MNRFKKVLRKRRRQWHEAIAAVRVARLVVVCLDPGVRFNPAEVASHSKSWRGVHAVAAEKRARNERTRQARCRDDSRSCGGIHHTLRRCRIRGAIQDRLRRTLACESVEPRLRATAAKHEETGTDDGQQHQCLPEQRLLEPRQGHESSNGRHELKRTSPSAASVSSRLVRSFRSRSGSTSHWSLSVW